MNENENRTYQPQWEGVKAVHGGILTAVNTYIKRDLK